MKTNKYLYLICSPNKWYEDGSKDNYKVNNLLLNLKQVSWSISSLKNIYIGMQGIIKVSRDDRPKYFLDKYNVEKLKSGIYATFEVIDFYPDKKNGKVTIKIIDNFFKENKIIAKEKAKEILGDKFRSQSQGYISNDVYKLIYEEINKITYQDMPKLRKELVVEKSKEFYPRDEKEKIKALELANYKCEIDTNHTTFISKINNKSYIEGHHLIPISKYDLFEYDIDVQANIVSLCPTCHRKLHSGIEKDIYELLNLLYKKREYRLKNAGLSITIEKLKQFYKDGI